MFDLFKVRICNTVNENVTADVFLAESPNHDEPYASFADSPICFRISINTLNQSAQIETISSESFESSFAYVSTVLASFAKSYENSFDSPVESFEVHY